MKSATKKKVWKVQNNKSYPTQWLNRKDDIKREGLKDNNKPYLVIKGKSCIQTQTFINDAAKVWNNAPSDIKECKSLHLAKNQIKSFVKTLPL